MKSKLTLSLYIYLLFTISLIYVVWSWPYSPMDAITDGKKLGMWGILIDVGILLPVVLWWRIKRKKETESLNYQRNELESEGEV